MPMKQAVVGFDDEGVLYKMDVIEYQGEPWLVPMWRQNKDEGWMQPARIVRMATLRYQEAEAYGGYILNDPMPRAVFEGQPPEGGPYQVILLPDIRIPTGGVQ